MDNQQNNVAYNKLLNYVNGNVFQFNLEELPNIEEFQEIIGEQVTLVGECLLNIPENFPPVGNVNREYYDYTNNYMGKKVDYVARHEFWNNNDNEWLYFIVYNGHIVKIGMTTTSIKGRFGSYSCGTTRAMGLGTCSTTNYIISECNFAALNNGMNVSIYGIRCPTELREITRFGSTKVCSFSVIRDLETMLTNKFVESYGHLPVLCVQHGN
jgi:hypothetical protein